MQVIQSPGVPRPGSKGAHVVIDPKLFENNFCALFLFSNNFDDFMPFLTLATI
jgi:hypothetical protein